MKTDFDYPTKDLIGPVALRLSMQIKPGHCFLLPVKTTKDWDKKLSSADFSLTF
jgi:hypothetical protein